MKTYISGMICAAMLMAGLAAPASAQSYTLRPGDTLQVEVLEDSTLNRNVLVLPDGTVNFPMAGRIQAGGRSVEAVRGSIAQALSPNFVSTPTVFAAVGALADRNAATVAEVDTRSIYVIGEAAKPGKLEIEPGATLLQALAQAGGFSRFAALKRIELRRPTAQGEQVWLFNYAGKGQAGISGATVLMPGDVIVVPQRRLFE